MTLWDDVTEALTPILQVIKWEDVDAPLDPPFGYISYAGHERPTSAGWKEKAQLAAIIAFAEQPEAHATVATTARAIAVALEAAPALRLLEMSSTLELATPTSDKVIALGLEIIVIEA